MDPVAAALVVVLVALVVFQQVWHDRFRRQAEEDRREILRLEADERDRLREAHNDERRELINRLQFPRLVPVKAPARDDSKPAEPASHDQSALIGTVAPPPDDDAAEA